MNLRDSEPAELRRFDIRSDFRAGDSAALGELTLPRFVLASLLVLVALPGCNSGANPETGSSSGNPVGSLLDHTDPDLGSLRFVVDRNSGGAAGHPRVIGISWGRLANIYDSTGTRQQVDMVIGRDIPQVDPANFEFEVNAVTGENSVTIKNFAYGTPEYANLFRMLDANLTPIQDKSLEPNELPPYSLAPRNSAIVVRFDDLLDESTIAAANIKVLTGNPPVTPFDLRVIPDVNHGDTADFTHPNPSGGDPLPGGDGIPEFHTTRIIIDTTVSELESGASNPPLPVNALGLPESPTPNLPNVAIRLPTALNASAGQLTLLRNLVGHSVSFSQSGSNDPDSPTSDVVRAFRSGNSADQNRGFLFDNIPPQVVGAQAVFLGTVTENPPGEFHAPVTFAVPGCANRLKEGDVVQQPGVFAEVVTQSGDPVGGQILDVALRIVSPIDGRLNPGPAQVSTIFDPVLNAAQRACFVRFPNISSPPAAQVATDSSVIIRFSEPINPVTVKPFDSFTITRGLGAPTPTDYIIADIIPSSDLRQFTYVPILPFDHDNASAEQYFVNMAEGTAGPTDLAGNPLATALPQFGFTIDPSEATENNGGFALRFSSTDELNAGDGPEVRGQYLYDLTAGILRPRSVSRFAAAATRDKPVPSIMRLPVSGVQTPLSPLGSKMQTIWRYCDVGFGLQDESFFNVDVEGLSWAPIGGSVVPDTYERFEILLSHSLKMPDEVVNPLSLLPLYPLSGLVSVFSGNVLDSVNDPQKVVHNRALGYVVDPADRFLSNTTPTVTMMPYPLNRNLPVSQHKYYTWRDTALQAKGVPVQPQGGQGAELAIVIQVLNLPVLVGTPYPEGLVPTIGLPLLMEFRCFPDAEALGLNSFDINIAINSSSIPNFRAFSTGGNNSSGVPVPRDPDLMPTALGGFNPNSNPPGLPTIPVDNVFYIGQMDLVIRISRAHTIWFNSQSPTPIYSPPVIEPRASDQPSGSGIELAFRGGTIVTGAITTSALALDAYGEVPLNSGNGTVTFLNNDDKWKNSINQIQGARFFQVRITFVSNAETSLSPTLSALGFAFRL
ncbi:MAG: Ig-like domain-containing protein [Planctomycetota bacterium]